MCKSLIGSVVFLVSFHITQAQNAVSYIKDTVPFTHIKTIPPQFYTKNLTFFCQKELQLQKATGLPIFIRLGNKDYVDYLEQKPNARRKFWENYMADFEMPDVKKPGFPDQKSSNQTSEIPLGLRIVSPATNEATLWP